MMGCGQAQAEGWCQGLPGGLLGGKDYGRKTSPWALFLLYFIDIL